MTTKIEQTVRDNYLRLKNEIAETSIRCGRELSGISPILVAKYQPVQKINAAIDAGACHFAENYPEMLIPKLPEI